MHQTRTSLLPPCFLPSHGPSCPLLPLPQHGGIEFKGVEATYRPGGRPMLRRLSFHAFPGNKVGIVGRSGTHLTHCHLSSISILPCTWESDQPNATCASEPVTPPAAALSYMLTLLLHVDDRRRGEEHNGAGAVPSAGAHAGRHRDRRGQRARAGAARLAKEAQRHPTGTSLAT